MRLTNLPVRITSFALVGIGIVLLALSIYTGGSINVALPLVFIVLGGGFFIVVFSLRQTLRWALFLYIPATLLTAFGIVFLINVLTQDWNAWAYAWLFLVAAIGLGLLLANREHTWHPVLTVIGWPVTLGGITLFVLFGAIAGGLFIQVMAPILLVAAGVSLRWLRLETILPVSLRERFHLSPPQKPGDPRLEIPELVEALSLRELEVLRLIDAGLSNQQIADKLSVAASTVKTHINNIYGKLGVQTRIQAVNRARDLKLFDN